MTMKMTDTYDNLPEVGKRAYNPFKDDPIILALEDRFKGFKVQHFKAECGPPTEMLGAKTQKVTVVFELEKYERSIRNRDYEK